MIHVYYGDGKGKTTAALGLVMRARGRGMGCAVIQFLKDWDTGELAALDTLGVRVLRGKAEGHAFSFNMTDAEKAETRRIHERNLQTAFDWVRDGSVNLVVLDEALDAVSLDLLGAETLTTLLDEWRGGIEIVVTGHKPVGAVNARADYITEMVKIAHPYDSGITARKGVEF